MESRTKFFRVDTNPYGDMVCSRYAQKGVIATEFLPGLTAHKRVKRQNKEVEIVMQQTNCTKDIATQVLNDNHGDIILTIMTLQQ